MARRKRGAQGQPADAPQERRAQRNEIEDTQNEIEDTQETARGMGAGRSRGVWPQKQKDTHESEFSYNPSGTFPREERTRKYQNFPTSLRALFRLTEASSGPMLLP